MMILIALVQQEKQSKSTNEKGTELGKGKGRGMLRNLFDVRFLNFPLAYGSEDSCGREYANGGDSGFGQTYISFSEIFTTYF